MVAAFDGWNDACQSATNVIRHLVSKYRSLEVGHISRDGYYDYQTSRPMQCVIQGTRRILWPQTVFYDIAVTDDLHLLAQLGPEPNYRWMDYVRETLHFAKQYDVSRIVTLGSMFAECPHTRDLPIDVSVDGVQSDPDSEYTRDGLDLYTSAKIPYATAVLGGEAMLPTLHGSVKCKIPAGIQSGSKIRLKEKGIHTTGRSPKKGDEYVEIRIAVPRNISPQAKKKLEEYSALVD